MPERTAIEIIASGILVVDEPALAVLWLLAWTFSALIVRGIRWTEAATPPDGRHEAMA